MALNDVSNILWQERRLLELLVFKLEEEQLVLAAGRTRWLSHATREVDNVLEEIKKVELQRAIEVEAVVHELGLSSAPSLRELAELTTSPWNGIFEEHRRALLETAQEIDSVARANRDLLSRGQQAAREALATIGHVETDSYTAKGSAAAGKVGLRLIDEAM
jgi:flagellar FlgN protein